MIAYSDHEWTAVEAIIGGARASAREELEWLGRLYLRYPKPQEERERYADAIARMQAIARGIIDLKKIIEVSGWKDSGWSRSFTAMTKSMDIVEHELQSEILEYSHSSPKTRSDRGRAWLLHALCLYWFYALQRTEKGGTVNGGPSSPIYSFLLTSTAPWFQNHLPLTLEMASHAVSEYRGQRRTSHKRRRALNRREFHDFVLLDDFELTLAFDERCELGHP